MVRYAVGYRSRAIVTFGKPLSIDGVDPTSRREVLDLAHTIMEAVGRLHKVLPTAVVANAMRPSITRRELESRADAVLDTLRSRGRQPRRRLRRRGRRRRRSSRSRRAASSLRSADASVFATAMSSATTPARSTTCSRRRRAELIDRRRTWSRRAFMARFPRHVRRVQSRLLRAVAKRHAQAPGVEVRHAVARQLRAALHRRRNRRGGDRASRRIQADGLHLTLDYLGESVRTLEEADAATREYVRLLDVIVASGIERNISLKLTQLGAGVDRATCVDNLRRILEPAGRHGFFVRIDMENSPWTQLTLDVFETLWQQEYRNIGIALQAALHRTEQDVRRMNELGARVRLVKGAYKEPQTVAYQRKADVDAAFLRLMRMLLDARNLSCHRHARPGDDRRHAGIRRSNAASANDRFEFQMLYGIRRDLQAALVS